MVSPYCDDKDVAHYTCYRTREPILVDGRLSEAAWRAAPRSPRFVDMVDGGPALYDTRAAALWDDTHFYVAFWVEEPFVTASLTRRDSLIFTDNDVEVFIDGGDAYYEFEINAFNTVYEVFFVWQDAYKPGGPFDVPEFDVLKRGAVSFGGNHDRSAEHFWRGAHPRGLRWAYTDWDMPGLRTAVHVDGAINDPATVSRGWTVALAFPWAGMGPLAHGRALPPRDGDEWGVQFARFQKLIVGGREIQPHPGWTWGRVGTYDNHVPECFTRVHFSTQDVQDLAG